MGWSVSYILGLVILITSIGIYISTKSFSETTLSFVLGLLTVYSIDWNKANIKLFIILYLAYIMLIFCISSIRLSAKQESILIQAACKLNINDSDEVYKRLKKISEKLTKYNQLSIIDKCEIIRYLSFRQISTVEYEEAINLIELFVGVCQTELIPCCEIYYGFYTYCYNLDYRDVSQEIEKMFDKVTSLNISYASFFEIFSQTKRILVEKIMTYDNYIIEIKSLAISGYSESDIIDILRKKYLQLVNNG